MIRGKAQNSRPKYMIVLDYPTKSDDKWDNSPTGDVEAKLKYFCHKAGINYSEVYVTNAIKCFVDKKDVSKIKKEHIEACSQYLLAEIEKYKPKVIIPCGKTAFRMLSEYTSVDEFVGHDFDFEYQTNEGSDEYPELVTKSCKSFPSYSINASLFLWENNNAIIRAFKKAKQFVEKGTVDKTPDPKINLILTLEALKEFEERIITKKLVATDFETTGLTFWQDKIINSGYCGDDDVVDVLFHIPYKKRHIQKWSKEEVDLARKINMFIRDHGEEIKQTLKRVHESKIRWILHNAKFDLKFANFHGIPFKHLYHDTLPADSLIDENEGHSLNECYVRRDINYGPYDVDLYPYVGKKSKKSYQYIPPSIIVKYLGYDCAGTRKLQKAQVTELKLCEMYEHFHAVKMPSLEILLEIEIRGIRYDKDFLLKSAKTVIATEQGLREQLLKITDDKEFNPNSAKQISNYMVKNKYPLAKLEIPENSQGYSTKAEYLKKFLDYPKFAEFPKLIMAIKKISKVRGTYIDGKDGLSGMLQYIDSDNMLHPNFNMWTATTGRYSSNKPSVQVFPRPIKNLVNTRQFVIKTHPDWIMFEADFSALEQYIVACLAKDDVLIQKILDGTDIHSFNATTLGKALNWIDPKVTYEQFVDNCGKGKIPKEQIDKDIYRLFDDLRTKAKTVGFGLNYGKGADSFAEEFGITKFEASEMIDAYFGLYKKMKIWRDKTVERALNKGEIKLMSGRPRRFHMAVDWINSTFAKKSWSAKIIKSEIERQAMNFPIQGGAHEAFEEGCLRLMKRIKKEGLKAHLQLSIHDGIIGSCPPEEKEIIERLIKEEMVMTFNKDTPHELSLKIDVGFYSDRWYGEEI